MRHEPGYSNPAKRYALAPLSLWLVMLTPSPQLAAASFADVAISINTSVTTPLAPSFSGFNFPGPLNGVEYFDAKLVTAVRPLAPGWLRFPGGTVSMAFDWTTGLTNPQWLSSLTVGNPPIADPGSASLLNYGAILSQAKGGVRLSDFAGFAAATGTPAVVCLNTTTDSPSSAAQLVQAARSYGINVLAWELGNEPFHYLGLYPDAATYSAAMYPYYQAITAADPNAVVAVMFPGVYAMQNPQAWNNALAAYSPRPWNAASTHVYPILPTQNLTVWQTMQTLNGILAHGTTDYVNNFLVPAAGAGTPIFITEFNATGSFSSPFMAYLYNGLYLVESIARWSTLPNMRAVGVHSLYWGNHSSFAMLRAFNDNEPYLAGQVNQNPNFSTDTSADPNTPFDFYLSTPGLALAVANQAINNSNALWATSVYHSPTVPILGYDGKPVPALFAQAYQGVNGKRYLLIVNKAGVTLTAGVVVNNVAATGTLSTWSVSSSDPSARNTSSAPANVTIVSGTSANPVTVGPYSVTRVEW